MSLKQRRIQKGLEAHSHSCVATLNELLGTSFTYAFDWSCIPEGVVGWNWEQEDLDQLLYNSYYKPIEVCLMDLFADDFYKEAILEQIKGFSVVPGKSIASFEFAEGTMRIKHTLGVNQKGGERSMFFKDVVKALKNTIDNSLSGDEPSQAAPQPDPVAPIECAPQAAPQPASEESRNEATQAPAGETRATTLSGRLKLRRGSTVIATFESSGRFRGKAGSGSVATGRIELKGRTVGKVDGRSVRDRTGKTVGKIDGEVLRTNTGKRLCKLEPNGAIRLNSGKTVGRVEGASASDMDLIAGYLVLIGSVASW